MTPSAVFFKDSVGSHVMPVCAATGKPYAEEDARGVAVVVIVAFAESKPKAMPKVNGSLSQASDVFIALIQNMEVCAEEYEENGKEAFDRVCGAMHHVDQFTPSLEILKPFIAASFQASNWKQTVGRQRLSLSQIPEYIDEEAFVTQMTGAMNPKPKAPHIRFRHAAWCAAAQFVEDHDKMITISQKMITVTNRT